MIFSNANRLHLLAIALTLMVGSHHMAKAAEDPNFNRELARKQMMDLVNDPPTQEQKIINSGSSNPEKMKFLDYYREEILPQFEELEDLELQYVVFSIALDRALQDDDTEESAWRAIQINVEKKMNAISTSEEWKQKIKTWAELSKNLKGDLPEMARRTWKDIEIGVFDESQKPLLDRLSEIDAEITKISLNSKVTGKDIAETSKQASDIESKYRKGELKFNEAWQQLEQLSPKGLMGKANDVALTAAKLMHEQAVIRTKLAQSKGYKNWAEYSLAKQARYYSEELQTVDGRIQFFHKMMDATTQPYLEFLNKRAQEITDLDPKNLRLSQIGLITFESDTLVREYFPTDNIEAEWRKTMIASGFEEGRLQNLYLDAFPRDKKHTHAYMWDASGHKPQVLKIDAGTLNVSPSSLDEKDWHQANIYIVQNFRDAGPDAWTTMLHEGGHYLEYNFKKDLLGQGSASGYAETHSMTMERFFEDVDYLTSIGKNADNLVLSKELAELFVRNVGLNNLISLRRQVAYSLYDLELWNHEYTEDGEQFVERARTLFGDLVVKAMHATGLENKEIDWKLGSFGTSHFYGGLVRYMYVVADIAAQMTADKLWEKLEAETGRRTFLNQPTIAKTLIDAYYADGFKEPFPVATERFTGKKFEAESFVASIVKLVNGYQPKPPTNECNDLLAAQDAINHRFTKR